MRKIFSFLLVLLMAVMSVNASVNASVIASGDGWQLIDDGTLGINSNSAIQDYSSADAVPWHAYRSQVKYIRYQDYTSSNWGVGAYMFCDMPNLKEAMFNGIQASIGKYAFKNCPKLNDLVSSMSGVQSIGEGAFENCTSLQEISTPDCNTIGKGAFKNCTALQKVVTRSQKNFVVNENAFYGCTALKTISLIQATSIGDKAFYNCDKLEAINLNECTKIGKNAFEGCAMSTVTIGPSIQSIGDYAFFSGFANGSHLYMESMTAPTVGTDAFSNYGTITLHLPDNATGYNKAPWTTEFISETDPPEIYGALNGTTLTLYYDDQRSSRGGTLWSSSAYYKMELQNTATKIVIDATMSAARPTSMDSWFQNFKNVTKIENLSYIYTADVTEMSSLFFGCSSLQTIDLNGFYMFNVEDIRYMFSQCTNLQKIYCEKDWSQMSNITNAYNMFEGCTSLVGGRGTAFDSSHKGLEYARPDGGTDAPGYFWRADDDGINHQGIDNVQSDKVQGTKVIRDGMLLIERNGKTFNAQGVEVK